MASKPGILSEWPWAPLGKFKYLVLAPWVVDSIYSTFLKKSTNGDRGVNMTYISIFPFLLWRVIHDQIWISLSRFRTSKSKSRIVDKPIEFEQVDRESNWDDMIIWQGLVFYMIHKYVPVPGAAYFPIWRTDGIIITILLHTGPVEFIYYWLHRALHHHFLYSRYHSHHHSSIATEPITAVVHPFAEHLMYSIVFAIPMLTVILTETVSMASLYGYLTYIDFMNNMGHCNFEFVPPYVFTSFPLLKYIFYTPSYHSLHHTQFRTNYALFMPMYDYIYGTVDKSSGALYKQSLKRQDESPDVVHLTHPITPEIYHLRIGFASLASEPYNNTTLYNKWCLIMIKGLLWPLNWMLINGSTFVIERNTLNEHGKGKVTLNLQTWVVPKCAYQYTLPKQRGGINRVIEKAILDADKAGVKVLSLGLLNQGEELNRNGEVYIQKHPKLKIKVVDGSSLAAANVVNNVINIFLATTSTNRENQQVVVMRGKVTKVACSIALALCKRGLRVVVQNTDEFENLSTRLVGSYSSSKSQLLGGDYQNNSIQNNLILSTTYSTADHDNNQVWLVGDGFNQEEHMRAPKETIFIPYSQFPPWFNVKKNKDSTNIILRKDCTYYNTPAMIIPPSLGNVDSCENWLPRRVMSAWRVAGILHGLEDWKWHECGNWLKEEEMIDKVWSASLSHGFRPYELPIPAQP